MKEIWIDYIYNYQISNFGNLRNKKTNKILKININKDGYCYCVVSLGNRKLKKAIKIHRAVAEKFIENLNDYNEINHIDGNKLNNYVNNLEWCNHSQNMIHAYKSELLKQSRECHKTKLTNSDINFIINNYKSKDKTFGCRALSRKFNVHHKTIQNVLNGKILIDKR